MTIIWSVVIAIALIIEIFTFELISIWFAAGAIIALILEICGVGLVWQLVVFFIISIACIIATRPLFKRILAKAEGNTNLEMLVGKKYKLITAISEGVKGTIKINGVVWNAESEDAIEAGEFVELIKIEGTDAIVKKIEKNKENE